MPYTDCQDSQCSHFLQKHMTFLPQLLAKHSLKLAPVSGPRVASTIYRTWMRHKLVTWFEEHLQRLIDADKMDLDGFRLPVRLTF